MSVHLTAGGACSDELVGAHSRRRPLPGLTQQGHNIDLPPVVVPKFKLEMGSSQPRDPGYAQLRQDSWGSQRRLRVLVADTPRHCGA